MNGESTQLSIAVTEILHSSVYYPEESFSCSFHFFIFHVVVIYNFRC